MALLPELVEEVLIRFPPSEPHLLVRNILICKQWREIISAPHFGLRYRQFHRTAPLLGLMVNFRDEDDESVSRLVPVSPACPQHADFVNWCTLDARHGRHLARFVPTEASSCSTRAGDHAGGWRADDTRHGRVLLSRRMAKHLVLMVWDPITDHRQELPPIRPRPAYSWKAAVLCASTAAGAACDHHDCHRGGPFLVVYIGVSHGGAFSCIYSSDAAAWSEPVPVQLPRVNCINLVQSVLVRKALYFMFHKNNEVLEYDLEMCQVVSVIKLPPYTNFRRVVLTTTEDGGLGSATAIEHKLYLWSRKDGSKGDVAGWTQTRVINLEGLLRITDLTLFAHVVGYADGVDVIFFRMGDAFFTIDIKTCKVKEVYKGTRVYGIVPYMGFCTPALGGACAAEGPRAGAIGT
ncbi:hypothetical protein HU200_000461 [Digitaria exilis]|uniref:F-box protein AT5G49610-like beta-propeller domain-containing protein n=1 Tax=Digitaria exilis TaxID=1010633 RepID=A0A835FYV1_9POAL|nr:hypothetical protein HU200_000461 [Digitaria exilis]